MKLQVSVVNIEHENYSSSSKYNSPRHKFMFNDDTAKNKETTNYINAKICNNVQNPQDKL